MLHFPDSVPFAWGFLAVSLFASAFILIGSAVPTIFPALALVLAFSALCGAARASLFS